MKKKKKILIGVYSVIAFLGWMSIRVFWGFPDVDSLKEYKPYLPTEIYSADKVKIAEIFEQRRYVVELKDMSSYLQKAFIAAEDADFYSHHGIDFSGFLRALWHVASFSSQLQGGSTITQQLAKNTLLTQDRTLVRKIRDMILAKKIEHTFTKDQILEMYLNTIYLGNSSYGVEAAAQTYFHIASKKLSLGQSALIAGLAPAPSLYDPNHNPHAAFARQHYVLKQMEAKGMITAEQSQKAQKEKLQFYQAQTPNQKVAPYFVQEVLKKVKAEFEEQNVRTDGLKIYTTLNAKLQNAAQNAAQDFARQYPAPAGQDPLQLAILAIDARTGALLAMVGGRNFVDSPFNRAVQAKRQIGSCIKPFYYSYALDQGFSPTSFLDSPAVQVKDWKPANSNGQDVGRTTLFESLVHSYNIPSIHLYQALGENSVFDQLSRLGFGWTHSVPSLALGSGTSTLLQLVQAYSIFPNEGRLTQTYAITRIINREGNLLYDLAKPDTLPLWESPVVTPPEEDRKDLPGTIAVPQLPYQIITPQAAYVTLSILQSAVDYGTGRGAASVSPWVAGKTGTTNNNTDAWFVGMLPPYFVGGVWVGYDNPAHTGGSGAALAVPVWNQLGAAWVQQMPQRPFKEPAGLHMATLTPTGAGAESSAPLDVPVIDGTGPAEPYARDAVIAIPIADIPQAGPADTPLVLQESAPLSEPASPE